MAPSRLSSTRQAPAAEHDVVALDLDGVVYVGPDAVPYAADALAEARDLGTRTAFVTNNAARTPAQVADHLCRLGVQAAPEDVVNSAQAAAGLLAREVGPGSKVFVIGGEGLLVALRDVGLEPVTAVDDEPVAVVSGYAPDLPWERVRDGAILVARGLPWVATNTDASVPTPHGRGPGNGVLVGVVADFADRDPVVAGKPERALLDETVERLDARTPLFVGDRPETDVDGAHAAEMPAMLVLTGVSDLAHVAAMGADTRPELVGVDLRSLLHPHLPVEVDEERRRSRCGDVVVHHRPSGDGGQPEWSLDNPLDTDDPAAVLAGLRAVVGLAWARLDAGEAVADLAPVSTALGVDA